MSRHRKMSWLMRPALSPSWRTRHASRHASDSYHVTGVQTHGSCVPSCVRLLSRDRRPDSWLMRPDSWLMRQASGVLTHASCVRRHASDSYHVTGVLTHASCVMAHASGVRRQASCVQTHGSCVMRPDSCVRRQASGVRRPTAHSVAHSVTAARCQS